MAFSAEWGPVLVTGATGKQGGATAKALLARGIPIKVLVRDPHASGALALESEGAALVVGDMDDAASLRTACAGVYGVFSIQNPDYEDLEGNTEWVRAGNLIRAAKLEGVRHFVQTSATGAGDYYSLDSAWAEKGTKINSLVMKGDIETLVEEAGFPYWTILRPAFFMENLPFILITDQLVTAYDPTKPVPIVAVNDIGGAVTSIFNDREKFNAAKIEFAGELLTMPQVAAILSTAWDRRIEAPAKSPDEVIAAGMFPQMVEAQEWHNHAGMPARPEIAQQWGLNTTSLEQWADGNML